MRRGYDAYCWGPFRRWLWLAGSVLATLTLFGCASYWDDVTSRDHKFGDAFRKPPDPLVVLRDSKDGDKRAKAFAALREPKQMGGSDQEQDKILEILAAGAKTEPQFYARLMAVEKLAEFKDPRAVSALVEAYYNATGFTPQSATVLRCQALAGLGQNGNPAGVELLVRVVRQGQVEGPDEDRRRAMDERIAAARALGHFSQYQATEALVQVLKTDKDVALRNSAHNSLQASTGRKLPEDYQAWDDLLHQEQAKAENGGTQQGDKKPGILEVFQTGFKSKS